MAMGVFCVWRPVPTPFLLHTTSMIYFILIEPCKELVELERAREERDSHCTMLIVDSKSIQNADAGKKKV